MQAQAAQPVCPRLGVANVLPRQREEGVCGLRLSHHHALANALALRGQARHGTDERVIIAVQVRELPRRKRRAKRQATDDTEIVEGEPSDEEAVLVRKQRLAEVCAMEFKDDVPGLPVRQLLAEGETVVPAAVVEEVIVSDDTEGLHSREPSEREFGSGDEAGVMGHGLRVISIGNDGAVWSLLS